MSPKRIICALAAAAGALATAAPAIAAPNTYCVAKPGCAGLPAANLQAALDAAKGHAGTDRVELGSGDFVSAAPYSYSAALPKNQVNIVGAGADKTRLLTTQSGSVSTLTLKRGSVTDLEIVGPPNPAIGDFAVALDLTGRGERLKLTDGWVNVILRKDARLMTSTLTGGGLDSDRPAVLVLEGAAELTDSTVDASSQGVRVRVAGVLDIRRSAIAARVGVTASDGGGVEIHDSLIRGKGIASFGLIARGDSASSGVYATNVTVVGTGDGGSVGVLSYSDGAGKQSNVVLSNSVVTRAAVPLRRDAMLGNAFLKASNSAFDPTLVISEGMGEYSTEGNTDAAPGFVDAPGNDFHLASGSALIDGGNPAPDGGLSDLDRDGMPRSTDGNGDGAAQPDIGAFELQPTGGPVVPADPPPGEPPVGDPPMDQPELKAPVLSSLSITRARFRVGKAATARSARRARRGTAFRFSLSKDARVTIAFSRRVAKGGQRAAGKLSRAGRAGANRIAFSGRVGTRALKPGRYVATVRAADSAGLVSRKRSVRFKILR